MCGLRLKCWKWCQKYSFLFFGVAGLLLGFSVFIELLQSVFNNTKATWSPLRLMGQIDWLPVTSTAGALLTAQALTISVMYFMSSYNLIMAYGQTNYRLVAPWFTMHSMLLLYQAYIIYNLGQLRLPKEVFIVIGGTITNLVMLVISGLTVLNWMENTVALY